MGLKWVEVLQYSVLKDAKIIAGASGLYKEVKGISVFDCLKADDFVPDKEGTMYISLFSQFQNDSNSILNWLKELEENKSAGICTIEDSVILLDDKIIKFCNDNGFPIISVERDLHYRDILNDICVLLHFDDVHVFNELILRKILFGNLNRAEIKEESKKLNSTFREFIRVLVVKGTIVSDIGYMSLNKIFYGKSWNSYIRFEGKHIFVLSGSDERKLNVMLESILSYVKPLFENLVYGVGEVVSIEKVDKGLTTGITSLELAIGTGRDNHFYNSFDDITLLSLIKDKVEFEEFYDKFVDLVKKNDIGEKLNLIECVKAFVKCKGDYKKTGEMIFQHEGTVRYRINIVKSALGLKDDIVKFHEIISIFVSMDKFV